MILDFVLIVLTTLVGQVYDQSTGEGLPNISVYAPGTSLGTATNEEGYFFIRADISRKTSFTVSGIGYHTERFTIQPGQDAGIDIPMKEKNTQLSDVFVTPGANPALPLMARVRKARESNDHPVVFQPDYTTQLYLSDIQARHLKKRFWHSLQSGMILAEDSTCMLPLYHEQCLQGEVRSEAAMLSTQDYQILLSDLDHPVDFYKNTIPFYSTSFLSPLAADGNNFYQYYLADSIVAPQGKQYIVHFRTKNPYYNTFEGEMLIDSLSAALLRIQATVPRQVNANYLHHLSVTQTYDSLVHTLKTEQLTLLLDFAIKADTSHTFPTVLVQHTKIYPQTSDSALLPTTYNLLPADTAIAVTASLPLIRTAKWMAYIIQQAYMPTGTKIEFGNLSEIIHLNPQETVRVGLPLRTSPNLWKNVCLEAYAAYGVADQAWKGAGSIYWNLPTLRRNLLQLRYADEYIYSEVSDFDRLMRENAVWSPQMGITTALIKELYHGDNTYNSMVRQRDLRLNWESDWSEHVETQCRLSVGRMGYGEPTHNYQAQSSFFYSKLSAVVRLGWQEKKVDFFCHRHHVYSHLPVLYIGGEIGSFRLDGEKARGQESYEVYGKLNVMLRHHQPLGAGGELDYVVEAGLILGAVPYSMLNIFDGNQSYAYDPYRFTLMHNYQYAADRYMLLHMDWNGQGCLFNLIPGIRVLRLRELALFKMAWGGLSDRHNLLLPLPDQHLHSLSTPYVEIGCGIGNIFRMADLVSVWRLTHRDEPGAPTWSLRFRFHIDS